MKKNSWITFLLALALCLFCLSPAALSAEEGNAPEGGPDVMNGGMGGIDGPDDMGGSGGGQSESYSLPREPSTTIGENVIKYDLVEQGTPYDEAGLLTYKIEDGEATIMSCDPAITGELYIPDFIEGAPVTAVNDYAFLYCANMTALNLPSTVTDIGDFAFCYCTALQSVTMGGTEGNGVKIGEYAFYRDYDLTTLNYGMIEEIGDYCFSYSGIPNLELKEGLKRLGSYAFAYCDEITQITLPGSLTDVGDFVFCKCSALTYATFPADMSDETMGGYMFYDCDALTGITPSQAWTEIPAGLFKSCGKVDISCVLKEGIVKIGDEALYRARLGTRNLVIPSTVEEIGGYNFAWCSGIISITLPQGLRTIGQSAFDNCETEEIIVLPDSVESIGYLAFQCVNLGEDLVLSSHLKEVGGNAFAATAVTHLTIPASLTTVDEQAFCNMTQLESVVIEEGNLAENWGAYAFDGDRNLTSIIFPSTWSMVPIRLLSGCTSLASVDLSQGIKRIGSGAFAGCSALESIKLPEGITAIETSAFQGTGLTSVDIPDTVETIGDYAFGGASGVTGTGTKLTEVVLPAALKSIGAYAFCQCTQLETVTVNSALESIGEYAFYGCKLLTDIDLGRGVQSIGEMAFYGCTALKTAVLGSDLKRLEKGVFYGCTSLETVTLPDTLTTIASGLSTSGTFGGCVSLKQIILPNGFRTLGSYAFQGCTSLEKLNIPEGTTKIGGNVIDGCSALSELYLPASLQSVSKSAFENSGLVKVTLEEGLPMEAFVNASNSSGIYYFQNCSKLASINIPSNWTEVPKFFLAYATGPLEITIPASVTKICDRAFQGCTGLHSVTILGPVEEIESKAFAGCTKLTSITLPDSLRVIGDYAFFGCGLTSITIPDGVAEENFGAYAIGSCRNLTQFNLPSTWKRIPDGLLMNNQTITSFTIPEGVEVIGASAFRNSLLTGIDIPDTVTTIEDQAFMNCVYLTEINLPNSVESVGIKCFSGCNGLTDVTIPGSVGIIGPEAFLECENLRTVVIQEGVEVIQGYAFAFCPSLEEVTIPASVIQIGIESFYAPKDGRLHATVVPGSVGAEYAEMNLYIETDDNPIPEGMTITFASEYGKDMTSYMYTSPSFRSGLGYCVTYDGYSYTIKVQSMIEDKSGDGDTVPYNCAMDFAATIVERTEPYTGTDLTIPDYVPNSKIPIIALTGELFQNCATLRTVTFGANMEKMEGNLFSNCTNLRSVDMSRSKIAYVNSFDGCTSLSEIKWSPSLLRIDDAAFQNCTSLTSLNFQGTNLHVISASAFQGCTNLSSLTLVEGVHYIEDYAFAGTALTSVEVPASQHVLQPTAFDPQVTINFTGDATEILYHYIGADGLIHFDPVLPILLERNGIRIGQFFGEGLDNQDTYFISTESAGLNVPYGLQIPGSVTEVGEIAGVQTEDPAAELQASLPEPQPEAALQEEPAVEEEEPEMEEEKEPEQEPKEEPELKLYEVVAQAIEENPIAAVAILTVCAALIVLGGIRGYRRTLR